MQRLPSGVNSDVWATADLVLRVSRHDWSTYAYEHGLLRRLRDAGAVVPDPVAGSWELPGWERAAWSLTTRMPGRPMTAGDLSCAEGIAAFLHVLRGLDPDRVWVLGEPPWWPFVGTDLVPDLPDPTRVLQLWHDAALLPCHLDLHEGNVLQDGASVAVVDLGTTFVAPALLEFATIAFFQGWPLARRCLELCGQASDGLELFTLGFALHRWERYPVDAEHAPAVVRQCLSRLA